MKKAIVLFNFSGSYQGGAQKRYLRLFKYFQNSNNNYLLILNDSLYHACYKDNILTSKNNVICIQSLIKNKKKKNHSSLSSVDSNKQNIVSESNIRLFFGQLKYYLKIWIDVIYVSFQFHKIVKKYNLRQFYLIYSAARYLEPYLTFSKKKYIYSENDCSLSFLDKSELKRWSSEYRSLKKAYKVDCLSPQIKKDLLFKGIVLSPDKLIVTPNSFIDYSNFDPKEKKNTITFCSRLEKLKNASLLVEAVDLIRSKLQDYKVFIIGTGGEFSKIKKLIAKKGLTQIIIMTGGVPSPYNLISTSRIFVSVQQTNNYPSQSLLEAMSCENAIIASDVGETRLLVTENEGILVALTPESIAEALLKLINDKESCINFGKKGRHKVITEHTVESFARYFNKMMDY